MSGINVNFDVVNQKGTPAFYTDVFANRPTFGYPGRVFISTDTGAIYEDTGTAWTLIADATGPVTGGTLQSVTTSGNSTNNGIVISANGLSSNSITNTSLTTGSVSFVGASGLMTQDNTNLFWDNTSKYLGIGPTGGPTAPLDIHNGSVNVLMQLNATSTNNSNIAFLNGGVGKWRIGNLYNAGANSFQIYDNASATARLTILNSGATTLNGALTSTSVAITGGTSAQFLKADGSVDSNTYITTNTSQTIAAGITKTFNNEMRFGLGTMYDNSTGVSLATGFTTINAGLTGSNTFLQVWRSNAYKLTFNCDLTSAGSTFTLPAGQSGALIATATGTSSQLIAGDGTLISAGTNITITGGTISASGGGGSIAIGSTITSATAGSVLYAGASGVLAQSNANFYYDYTNNRLGLGTTSPQVQLSVVSTGDNYGLFIGPNAGGTSGKRLKLGYYSTGNYSVIQSINDGTAATSLILQKDGGNVGIGTTTADSELVINGSSSSRFNFKAGNTRYGTIYSDSGLLAISTITAIPIVFGINDVEKMRLSSSFNLLIGTTTDSGYKLDVQGTFRTTGATTLQSTLAVSSTSTFSDNISVSKNQDATTSISLSNTTSGTSSQVQFSATSDGTSGANTFGKYSSTKTAYKIVQAKDAYYYNGSVAGDFAILNDYSAGSIKFAAGGSSTAQLTLTSSNNLLLGTTTDSGQGLLQIAGGITGAGVSLSGEVVSATATLSKAYYHVFNGSTGQTLTLPSPSSNNYIYVIINNTANAVTIAAATSTNIITTANTSVASFTLIANARTEIIADGNNKYYQIY